MPLKFAANISLLFKEAGGLSQRYAAAAAAGFKAVECVFPYEESAEDLAAAKEAAGLQHVLLNAWPGDLKGGDAGLAALPNRVSDFRDSLEKTIQYALLLRCPRIHIMAGIRPSMWTDSAMEEVYVENLKYAADRLQKAGIMGLIEPVNSFLTLPQYYMDNADKAVSILNKVNHPNLRLQLDIYHLQLIQGNLTANIKKYLPYTEHIQIAQVPARHEPQSAGEVNYDYVFKLLEEEGYQGWVGLEFNPSGPSHDVKQWTLQYQ